MLNPRLDGLTLTLPLQDLVLTLEKDPRLACLLEADPRGFPHPYPNPNPHPNPQPNPRLLPGLQRGALWSLPPICETPHPGNHGAIPRVLRHPFYGIQPTSISPRHPYSSTFCLL